MTRRARARRRARREAGTGRGRGRRILGGLVAGGVSLLLFVWFVVIPWPWGLGSGDPGPTALMEQRVREARAAGEPLEIRQEWVGLDRISPLLVRAVVVAEDDRFREHEGVDWRALAEEVAWVGGDSFSWRSGEDRAALREALRYAWENREEMRGRSTITQQLAKNLYFGTRRSLLRKGKELIVARRLERRLDKDRILELYLNVAEWGPGVFGAEAASREHFGRSAADLTLEQAAALAATLPHPLTSNPSRSPGQMQWRQALILQRLAPGAPPQTGPIPVLLVEEPELSIPEPYPAGDSVVADTTGADGSEPTMLEPEVIPENSALPADTSAIPEDP